MGPLVSHMQPVSYPGMSPPNPHVWFIPPAAEHPPNHLPQFLLLTRSSSELGTWKTVAAPRGCLFTCWFYSSCCLLLGSSCSFCSWCFS